jgi:hypothetical protein
MGLVFYKNYLAISKKVKFMARGVCACCRGVESLRALRIYPTPP